MPNPPLQPVQELEAVMGELFRLFKEGHLRDMAVLHLSAAQGYCLKTIGSLGAVTMGQLADYMALSSAAVTSLVDRLAANGWVAREPDDKDRRIVRARLTDSGQALFDQLKAYRVRKLGEALATLSTEEQVTLLQGLSLFAKALGSTLKDEPPAV